MRSTKTLSLVVIVLGLMQIAYSQRGKDGNLTLSTANNIINTYTYLTADATVGATSITVNNNAMTGGVFGAALAPGDLVLIVQMQGAAMNNDNVFCPSYSVPNGFTWNNNWFDHAEVWGSIGTDFGANGWGSYNNAGKYEQAEVLSVSGGNTINLQCGLKNTYNFAGHVQVVRVPRFNNLTVSGGANTIVPTLWNGQTGGIVAIEVLTNMNINAGSSISADGAGFRGGALDNTGKTGGTSPATQVRFLGTSSAAEGSEKGEGIFGFYTEYDAICSRYGIAAPVNGGGGGGYQNAGGGGGANVYNGALRYTGTGTPNQNGGVYTPAWNLDISWPPNPNTDVPSPAAHHLTFLPIGTNISPGGGRGGHALGDASSPPNPLTTGPNNASWAGDSRKSNGGLGGHPIKYDATRIFFGGGGGAGDQDSGQGGAGGRGGGIVFITNYGTTTGSGSITANGAAGQNSNPGNQTASYPAKKGNDGAGGGGAGGYIYIQNGTAIPATITLNAIGGNGGNQNVLLGFSGAPLNLYAADEAGGPGGSGTGGGIAFTSGTPTQNVSAGVQGVVTSNDPTPMMANFPPNGATNGYQGMSGLPATYYNLTANNATICAGNTANISVTAQGSLPGSVQWYTQQFGGSSVNTGLTYTTPALASTTTYYVGICPGSFRVPVTVTVVPTPTLVITNPAAVCAPGTVNLTAPAVTAGSSAGTLTYWTNAGATTALSNPNAVATSGTYYIQLDAGGGCTTVQPVTVTITPAQDASFTMTPTCFGGTATITGTTGGTFSFNPAPGDAAVVNASTGAVTNGTLGTTYFVQYTTPGPCPASSTQSVTAATTLAYTVTITPENCGAGDGQIDLVASGGTGVPYQYSITGGAPYSASGTFGSLTAGTYNISILDNSGCEITGTESLSSTGGPTIDNVVANDPSCAGVCDGSITVSVSGGIAPYTYQWFDATMTPIGTNSATITGLCEGNYSIEVTDAAGSGTLQLFYEDFETGAATWNLNVVTGPEGADANFFQVSDNEGGVAPTGCGVANNGDQTLHITSVFFPSGGAAYDAGGLCGILFCPQSNRRSETPAISTIGQTGLTLNFDYIANGDPGNDFATVWYNDGLGWTQLGGALSSPVCGGGQGQWTAYSSALPASCENIANLQIAIHWQNNDDGVGTDPSVAINNLEVITSGGGACPAIANMTLTDPPAPAISGNAPVCEGSTLALTGSGTPDPATPWTSSNAGVATISNAGIVTGVSGGSTTITYTDNNGCQATAAVTVLAAPNIGGNSPLCIGSTVALSGSGTPDPATPWSSASPAVATVTNAGVVTGVSAGSSVITYTDNNGCTNTVTVTVNPNPTINGNNPVCIGSTVALSGSGSPDPATPWTSSNPAVATVSNAGVVTGVSAGSSTITYLDANGCSSTVAVTVNPDPVISNNAPVCVGSTVALSGSGSPDPTTPWTSSSPGVATVSNTGVVTGVSAGSSTITYTDANGCQTTVSVTVSAIPTISGNAPVCVGSTLALSGTGTPDLTTPWTSSSPAVATVSNTGVVTGVSGGTSTVTYMDINGCQNSVMVIVAPNPVINTSQTPLTSCNSNDGIITVSDGIGSSGTVSWTGPSSGSVSTTLPYNITGLAPGIYDVTFTNSLTGCTSAVSQQTLASPGGPTITGNSPACIGTTVQLTGTGTPDPTTPWTSSAPGVATVSNTGLVTGVSAGSASITYLDVNGCSNSVSVVVNPDPVISTSQTPLTACNSNDGVITVSDAGGATGTVTWGGPASGSTAGVTLPYNISALAAGTYDVTFTDGTTGCTSATSQEILINPGAPLVDDIADLTACDSYTLPVITGSGLTGSESYWSGTGGTGTQYPAGTSITTSMTVYIYDANGACADEESFILTVEQTPVLDPVADVTVCDSYTLPAITGTNLSGNESYFNDSQANGGTPVSGTLTSTQTVWIYDANATCTDETSFLVTVNPSPQVVSMTGGGDYCQGDVLSDIQVNVSGTANWTLDYTLDGSPMTVNGTASPLSLGNTPGVYVLTSLSDANCSASVSATQTITVNPVPSAPTAGTDATYCTTDVFSAMVASGTGGTLTWYSDAALTDVLGTGGSFVPLNTEGTVTYYVTETANGCESAPSQVVITVQNCGIVIPTAFTPDGDLVNDFWEILYLDDIYPDNIVRVYNRWGNLVYEHKSSVTNPYSLNMWDGTYQGQLLPVASYYFIIDFNDGHTEEAKGSVSIILNK